MMDGCSCARESTISASRCVEVPSRHRGDSCPSDEVVGGFFDFEQFRTASSDRDAPRRYPPACKVFELSQLGQKYERRLGCACVDVWCLSPDLGKMVFLLSDRTLDFHAPYGTHYKVRVPSAGRRLLYDGAKCTLHVASGQRAVAHRLDLDSGTFLSDLAVGAPSSCCDLGRGVPLTAFGCEDGIVRFFDARTSSTQPVALLDVGNDVTSIKFDGDGLNIACGTSDAEVKLYDLRSKRPTLTKAHQNMLPIVDLKWHSSSKETASQLILSSDARVLKAWDSRTGSVFTNVEPSSPLNHVAVAPSSDERDSGLILMAGEQARVMAYYVPALGRAPRWCASVWKSNFGRPNAIDGV